MSIFPDFSHHNYTIIQELGRNREGGRISYLGESLETQQKVVIKQFRFVDADASWTSYKAYEREISILETLDHPRIPHYLTSFETEDGFCMVQEYKEAPSLANKSNFLPEQIQKIAISVLEILVYLQNHIPPIIHRDLKPENILIDNNLNAYLIDFGLAKIRDGEVANSSIAAGTPGFMPPEELFNRPLTEASDLYSLGATLICLLTHTSSSNISQLIDEDYCFKFNHLIVKLNPQFITWLSTLVNPLPKQRYPNAEIALNDVRSLNINALLIPNKKPFLFYSFAKAVMGFIMLGFLMGGVVNIRRFFSSLNTNYQINVNPNLSNGEAWYQEIKPHCNSVEVGTAMKNSPPPNTSDGIGLAAGCYALAGKIEQADQLIQTLPKTEQFTAAGIVFAIGHPVADAGDDESAGPIMELVIKYQPENFMAVYHAGMSEYVLGDYAKSKANLTKFLELYQQNDGWRSNAIEVLNRMNNE
ncbi:serine/threonine-protein kinase [Crocosphaera sp. XPORK-15E]|uniref:serine/threonine-protein kinase n=1 Tax=Crocosphaera sp. XPORK-15E TaxID=3110247 RepID=UPI002B1FBF2E|nr:serine/threonine-protein kinase [Crocosphaera sp. XPORK-15E]MEA5534760.1 serine/threonine-protein kinase [Crocosphaera sp. XPORK-15E]